MSRLSSGQILPALASNLQLRRKFLEVSSICHHVSDSAEVNSTSVAIASLAFVDFTTVPLVTHFRVVLMSRLEYQQAHFAFW